MKITAVESFDLRLPASEAEQAQGAITTTGVTRVRTDAGITGYAFHGVGAAGSATTGAIAPLLVGQDPLAIEQHLQRDPEPSGVAGRRARALGHRRQGRRPAGIQAARRGAGAHPGLPDLRVARRRRSIRRAPGAPK